MEVLIIIDPTSSKILTVGTSPLWRREKLHLTIGSFSGYG
jgi:hypothetical protein